MPRLCHFLLGTITIQTDMPVPATPRWDSQASPYTCSMQDWGHHALWVQPAGCVSRGTSLLLMEGLSAFSEKV